MTEEKQKKEGVGDNYHTTIHTDTLSGLAIGKKNKVTAKVIIKSSDKKDIAELQKALSDLMQHVQNHDADFEIKANAYGELKQIREHLENLEDASPETKGKLRELLSSVKDGSLGAIKLGTEIKDAYELMETLPKVAATVITFLTTI